MRWTHMFGCELDFVSVNDGWCTAIGAAAGGEFMTLYRTTTGGRRWQLVYKTAHAASQTSPGWSPVRVPGT